MAQNNLSPIEIRFLLRLKPLISEDNFIYYKKWSGEILPVDSKEILRLFGFSAAISKEIINRLIGFKIIKKCGERYSVDVNLYNKYLEIN
jgi:hypothetical protein